MRLFYTLADYPHDMVEIECAVPEVGRHERQLRGTICALKPDRLTRSGFGRCQVSAGPGQEKWPTRFVIQRWMASDAGFGSS
jgi:hypothetical protein